MKLLPIERRVGGSNVHPETIVTEIVAYAQVDDNHHNHLRQFRWTQGNGGYPRRRAAGKKIVFLHQEVMQLAGIPAGRQTDHIDGDVLNNQTSNLRPVSHRENGANRKLGKDSKTGYKGVSFDSRRGKYQVMLRVHGVMRFLGYFHFPSTAALVYDVKARELFGEFARTNQSLGLLLPIED